MNYQVLISRKAIKMLSLIPEPYFSKIKTSIAELATEPRPPGCKKLKGREGYRIRIAEYRVIYKIVDKQLVIEVIAIGHRKDIYD